MKTYILTYSVCGKPFRSRIKADTEEQAWGKLLENIKRTIKLGNAEIEKKENNNSFPPGFEDIFDMFD